MTADSFALCTYDLASFSCFRLGRCFGLARPLLRILKFFGEQRFLLLRAIELPPEIVDLRLKIAALRIVGGRRRAAGRGFTRSRCALAQRNDLLLTGV